ncbi:uncharacterized protein MYCFIDRAFT_196577 [Pseudocercospora fijiensis CIRAD86]|uniref:Mediator of RNA polymerase II transcription subunit 1 n=1 Tax=Pseudocercospora fijiensis (strain CIRAD86) TaxID=383855 RepID=M3B1G6_PSEFD|nr:uncharacterized protein MYCFIDRAFT_196577 [Pseudocercospora fijiensis CIRAD86]EME83242.1 hypothetical protein MYCFIDRAFT_196577 [Pseudocercospora fijiensis CIRAD86]
MVQSLSQTGMNIGSSPGGGHMSFGTPLHGLGVDLGSATPGHLNVPTPLLQSVGMAPTMSEIMHGVGKRNEEEERRLKMRSVLNTIGQRKGRSCEESIARVASRVELDISIDDDNNRKVGSRTIAMAGSSKVLVDVELQNHAASEVKVSLMGSEALMAQQEAASKVLLHDLAVPNGILLNAHLDKFAANLNKLATLDKLSTEAYGGVDCFEAITGIYTSLKKLYEMEKDAVKTLKKFSVSEADRRAEHEVLCKRSGRPSVHEGGKIGLSLAYWSTDFATSDQDDTAMDVDGDEGVGQADGDAKGTWSVDIEVEKSSAGLYPSMRLSDAWLPEFFELPSPESGESLPWQEPPPTYVNNPATDKNDAMAVEPQRLPDLRFIAKFDPPLVVPLQTAMNILNVIGAQPPSTNMFPAYHYAVLNVPSIKHASPQDIRAEKKVLSLHGSDELETTHCYNLDLSQVPLSMKLERLPFSHPRQLIELLPTLRQWASTGALLHGTFGDDPTESKIDVATTVMNGTHINNAESPVADSGIELEGLMEDAPTTSSGLQVDMGFATAPNPTISVAYTDPDKAAVVTVVAQILPNADVLVSDIGDSSEEPRDAEIMNVSEEQSAQAKKIARALEVCGDIGVWIEWMRKSKP